MGVFTIVKGEEAVIEYRFKTDPNTAKDLTGYSVLIQIRPYKSSSTLIGSWNQDSPHITFTPSDGSVLLNLPPSITAAMDFTKGVIDCLVSDNIDVDGDRSPTYFVVVESGVSHL